MPADPERRRPGPLPGGSDARQLLLDAAERLFALNGVDAVSLRSVTAAAGLTSATLHYHFGSRDELLRAILERRRSALLDQAVFDDLESRVEPLTAASLIDAVIGPWIQLLRDQPVSGPLYLRLYSQLLAARDPRIQETMTSLTEQFRRLYSRLPGPASSPLRWGIAMDCLVHELAAAAELELPPERFEEHVAELVDFVASGVSGSTR